MLSFKDELLLLSLLEELDDDEDELEEDDNELDDDDDDNFLFLLDNDFRLSLFSFSITSLIPIINNNIINNYLFLSYIMTDQTIQTSLCERCYYLITNFTNDENYLNKPALLKLQSSSKCNFCFGIFDLSSYTTFISRIKSSLSNIDHTDFKLSINFSSIFELIHHYWQHQFKSLPSIKTPQDLNTNMLRVIFKQLFQPLLESRLHESFNPNSDLDIEITFEFNNNIYDQFNNMLKYLNKNITLCQYDTNKTSVNMPKLLNSLPGSLISELFKKFALNDLAKDKAENESDVVMFPTFKLNKQNIYIKGNYLKLTRDIGQTKWEINGVRVCSSSVEEEIKKKVIELFHSEDCIMSAGGREDRDVRMLGKGRPFVLEVINPYINYKDIATVENTINANSHLVKVSNLSFEDKNYFEVIKKYETSKMKYYTCIVWVEKVVDASDIDKLNAVSNLKVVQKTPLRVLHRRTLMDRNKEIYKLSATKLNDHFIIVNILASAGTYIKEFIHSDLGRTNPSLMSILNTQCDILQLDVLDLIYE